MSKFGQTLFGGGGFVRWALSPFVLLFAVAMPLIMPTIVDEWTLVRVLLLAGMELMCLCLLAGFWLPPRIGFWAFRILAGLVALAYIGYFVDEYFIERKPLTVPSSRGEASPFNAIAGFLVIGVPSLLFAVLGRFSLRPPPEPPIDEQSKENEGI